MPGAGAISNAQGFFTFLAIGVKRPRMNLDGPNNDRFVMDTAAFGLGATAHKCLIHFDWILSANGVTFRAHHASAKLVQNLEGGLVAQSQVVASAPSNPPRTK